MIATRPSTISQSIAFALLLTTAVQGQDSPVTTPEGVWQKVLKTFETTDGDSLTLRKSNEPAWEFFPHSFRLYGKDAEWSQYYHTFGEPQKVTGRTLNLHNKAKQGDIVLLEAKGSKPLVLVYAGERSFNDAKNTELSFFVYPYISRLEFNTFPPRLHEQLIEQLDKTAKGKEKLKPSDSFVRYSKPDVLVSKTISEKAGTWRWLQRPLLGEPPLQYPSEIWKKGTTYRILRPAGDQPLLVHLKDVDQMPCHRQAKTGDGATCLWAAYSDVIAYETRKNHPITQDRVVRYEKSLIAKYLEKMGKEKEDHLRAIYRVVKKAAMQKEAMEKKVFLSEAMIEKMIEEKLADNDHWEIWYAAEGNVDKLKSELKVNFKTPESAEDFVHYVEASLKADKPVIAVIAVSRFVPDTSAPAAPTKDNPLAGVVAYKHEKNGPGFAHANVIIALEKHKEGRVFLYVQDGLDTGKKIAGDFRQPRQDNKLNPNYIVRIDATEYWEKVVRHAGKDNYNNALVTETGPLPPLWVIGKD